MPALLKLHAANEAPKPKKTDYHALLEALPKLESACTAYLDALEKAPATKFKGKTATEQGQSHTKAVKVIKDAMVSIEQPKKTYSGLAFPLEDALEAVVDADDDRRKFECRLWHYCLDYFLLRTLSSDWHQAEGRTVQNQGP